MHRVVAIVLALLVCVACSPTDQAAFLSVLQKENRTAFAAMVKAQKQADGGGFDAAKTTLDPIVSKETYTALSPFARHLIDQRYGWVTYVLDKPSAAFAAYRRATTSSFAIRSDWDMRMQLAISNGDFADGLFAMKTMLRRWPEDCQCLSDGEVGAMDAGLETLASAAPEREFALLLHNYGWTPHSGFFRDDLLRYHEALALLADHKPEQATVVAVAITDPDIVMAMASDKRFDELVQSNPAVFTLAGATDLEMKRGRSAAQEYPDWLGPRLAVVRALIRQGDAEHALVTLDVAIARTEGLLSDPDAPENADTEFDLALGHRIHIFILTLLGRNDDALSYLNAMHDSTASPVQKTKDALDTARLLVDLGRGKEALTVLAPIASRDVAMPDTPQLHALRVCAASQAGDKNTAVHELTVLTDHPPVDPRFQVRALLCAGDMEGAGRATVAALASERQRALMLQLLQRYKPGAPEAPFYMRQEKQREALCQQPTVIAAVAKVGRINSYDAPVILQVY